MDLEIIRINGNPAIRARNVDKQGRTLMSKFGITVTLNYKQQELIRFDTMEEAVSYATATIPYTVVTGEELPKIIRKSKSVKFRENVLKDTITITGGVVNLITVLAVVGSIDHGYHLTTPSGLGSSSAIDYMHNAFSGNDALTNTNQIMQTISPDDIASIASVLWQ